MQSPYQDTAAALPPVAAATRGIRRRFSGTAPAYGCPRASLARDAVCVRIDIV